MNRIALIWNPINEKFMVIEQTGMFSAQVLFSRSTLFHAVANADLWLRRN